MSATFEILKPVKNVYYTGEWWDQFTNEELKKGFETDDLYIVKGPHNEVNTPEYRWSDKKKHEIFNLFDYVKEIPCKSTKRYAKKIKKMNLEFKFGTTKNGYSYKIIPVDCIVYAQGWFLKRKFFNKRNPTYIATTKEEMISFFKKYGRIPKNDKVIHFEKDYYCTKWSDDGLIETIKLFEEKWEDGCIFIASF